MLGLLSTGAGCSMCVEQYFLERMGGGKSSETPINSGSQIFGLEKVLFSKIVK